MTFNLLISLVAGPVAHLGERLVRNEKVAGSIPVRSTKKDDSRTPVIAHLLINWCFGIRLDARNFYCSLRRAK